MDRSTTLQEHLEEYLKREGLYDVIPEYRRPLPLPLPSSITVIWLAVLWILAFYFLLRYNGFSKLMLAILGPAVLLAATLLMLVAFFVVRQFYSGKKLTDADAGLIGGVLLFAFPVLMAAVLGVYLNSWSVAVWYVVLYAVGMIFALLQAGLFRLIFRLLWQSVNLSLVLVPFLLVVVLLSVFSEELWESMGSLSPARLVGSGILIAVPAIPFVLVSVKRKAMEIVGEFPDKKRIVENAESIPFVKNKLDGGFISEEEWTRLGSELEWRDKSKLAENLMPMLQSKAKVWLALLLGLTGIAVAIAFFAYFFTFFSMLLKPPVVATWVDMQLETLVLPLSCCGYSWEIGLPTTVIPVTKVSMLLAIFVVMMSSVYTLTDDSFKKILIEQLNQKATSWLAVSSIYQGAASPSYQIWEYVVRDRQKGIANVSIIVPKGLSEEEVEKACKHMESRLEEYKNLVLITAFEQNLERPVYRRGMPGNRWQLLHNKTKGIRTFEPIPLVLDELRYQYFLGMDSLQEEVEIPDGWFGNTPQGRSLAKAVWEADADHEWILHPYVFESDTVLSLEVHLMKRMTRSDQYRQYIRELLALTRQKVPDAQNVWIDLCFRDTTDTLARLNWSKQLSYVEYRDEIDDKSRIEKPDAWE